MRTKYKLLEKNQNFFFQTINEIIYTEPFLKLKNFRHHGNITTYTHVIKVAYMSYCYAVKHKWKINYDELIRSALLHDLYFYDDKKKYNALILDIP